MVLSPKTSVLVMIWALTWFLSTETFFGHSESDKSFNQDGDNYGGLREKEKKLTTNWEVCATSIFQSCSTKLYNIISRKVNYVIFNTSLQLLATLPPCNHINFHVEKADFFFTISFQNSLKISKEFGLYTFMYNENIFDSCARFCFFLFFCFSVFVAFV